ncbi:MAG: carbamoyltransferase HypF [Woeseiaceae bacterium]|nr:carbamoyltransferase HypF [Woeseiaceae bacterium]
MSGKGASVVPRADAGASRIVKRLIRLRGHVQGVGFRPFVYRLAVEHGITGHVQNQLGEVEVLVSGPLEVVERFQRQLIDRAPPLSSPRLVEITETGLPTGRDFNIIKSDGDAAAQIFVPPDYFMCDDCRRELSDPGDRRFGYPFINCTQCGPRYTLIEAMPYDRPNTSMAAFPLCADCETEYRDPSNRRFHAEPVACPACGPQISFAAAIEPLHSAVTALRNGRIVAVKGVGGFHLVCDARNRDAVATLRERKRRPDKPLAVMFPLAGDDGLDIVRDHVCLNEREASLVSGPIRPIVLASRAPDCGLAENVAPGLAEIGVFLPYSPLHQLLLDTFGGPLVATSGNISGEPVLTDNDEARRRLNEIADDFLLHDRPIVRPADDPVYRRIGERIRPLRIGRGCAPREMELPFTQVAPLLAVGGHMKGTVALSWNNRVVVSPHIGEMDSPRSLRVFEQVASDLQDLYGVAAERVVCDAHPGYTTRRWAERESSLPVSLVWHHEAHASAVAGEFGGGEDWLVFTWDGVGLGRDDTLWGGEALVGGAGNWRRFASLRSFRLPGGDKAGREPWRSAAALHWECGLEWSGSFDPEGLARSAWQKDINCPVTSAAGRLFDAASAIICELPVTSFEAQGPMHLEALCREHRGGPSLELRESVDGVLRSDWEPLLARLGDAARSPRERAEEFHGSMAHTILDQAVRAREEHDVGRIGLGGGVFQNRFLTDQVLGVLRDARFDVFVPEVLPCNDAALSFGQAAEVAARGE